MSFIMHFRQMPSPRRQKDPRITITNRGQFSVNTECYESFFKGYSYVILYYNPRNKIIGFKPIKEKTEHAYPIRLTREDSLVTISGASFLRHFEIWHDVSIAYPAIWDQADGMVKINLNEKGGVDDSGDQSGAAVRGEGTR